MCVFWVSVVSEVRERVLDLGSHFHSMLWRSSLVECVSVLHGTWVKCAELFFIRQYVQPCLSKILRTHFMQDLFTRKKSYFPRETPEENMTISRVNKLSYLRYVRELNVLFHQANVLVNSSKWNVLSIFVYKIIISEHLWSYMTKALNLENREIQYCWERNTMLLRGKYDVLINVTWDCFDQSNFYISRINIIEC